MKEETGHIGEASELQRGAFVILRKCLGPNHPTTAASLQKSVALYDKLRRMQELASQDVTWDG